MDTQRLGLPVNHGQSQSIRRMEEHAPRSAVALSASAAVDAFVPRFGNQQQAHPLNAGALVWLVKQFADKQLTPSDVEIIDTRDDKVYTLVDLVLNMAQTTRQKDDKNRPAIRMVDSGGEEQIYGSSQTLESGSGEAPVFSGTFRFRLKPSASVKTITVNIDLKQADFDALARQGRQILWEGTRGGRNSD